MLITPTLLSSLTAQAQASPRLRQHYDLRDSAEDQSQRMLNAIEPGTVIGVHRHTGTCETMAVLRGDAEEVFFDEKGNEIGRYWLTPSGMERGSFAAIKNGKSDPASEKEYLNN